MDYTKKLHNQFMVYNDSLDYYEKVVKLVQEKSSDDNWFLKAKNYILKEIKTKWDNKEWEWFINYINNKELLPANFADLKDILNVLKNFKLEFDLENLETILNLCPRIDQFLVSFFKSMGEITETNINKLTNSGDVRQCLFTYATIKNLIVLEEFNDDMDHEKEDSKSFSGFSHFLQEISACAISSEETFSYLQKIDDCNKLLENENLEDEKKQKITKKKDYYRKKIVEGNLKLVVSRARKFLWSQVSLEDLVQEGTEGMMRAIDRFDVSKGNVFSTYAVWHIDVMIQRYIYNNGKSIRIPVNNYELLNKARLAQEQYFKEFGEEPNLEQLAKYMDIKYERLKKVMMANQSIDSLDRIVGDSDDTELHELIASDYSVDKEMNYDWHELQTYFAILPEKLVLILRMRFGIPASKDETNPLFLESHSLEEVGNYLGVTRERVRQMEYQALNKIRQYIKKNGDFESNLRFKYYFWDYFTKEDRNLVLSIVDSLSQKDGDYLHNVFGVNLNKKIEGRYSFENILRIIDIINKQLQLTKGKESKSSKKKTTTKRKNLNGKVITYHEDVDALKNETNKTADYIFTARKISVMPSFKTESKPKVVNETKKQDSNQEIINLRESLNLSLVDEDLLKNWLLTDEDFRAFLKLFDEKFEVNLSDWDKEEKAKIKQDIKFWQKRIKEYQSFLGKNILEILKVKYSKEELKEMINDKDDLNLLMDMFGKNLDQPFKKEYYRKQGFLELIKKLNMFIKSQKSPYEKKCLKDILECTKDELDQLINYNDSLDKEFNLQLKKMFGITFDKVYTQTDVIIDIKSILILKRQLIDLRAGKFKLNSNLEEEKEIVIKPVDLNAENQEKELEFDENKLLILKQPFFKEVINLLPLKYRLVIDLFIWEGITREEIAKLLNTDMVDITTIIKKGIVLLEEIMVIYKKFFSQDFPIISESNKMNLIKKS